VLCFCWVLCGGLLLGSLWWFVVGFPVVICCWIPCGGLSLGCLKGFVVGLLEGVCCWVSCGGLFLGSLWCIVVVGFPVVYCCWVHCGLWCWVSCVLPVCLINNSSFPAQSTPASITNIVKGIATNVPRYQVCKLNHRSFGVFHVCNKLSKELWVDFSRGDWKRFNKLQNPIEPKTYYP